MKVVVTCTELSVQPAVLYSFSCVSYFTHYSIILGENELSATGFSKDCWLVLIPYSHGVAILRSGEKNALYQKTSYPKLFF